jgi:hypothetical protein
MYDHIFLFISIRLIETDVIESESLTKVRLQKRDFHANKKSDVVSELNRIQ